ncbi:hypothetical protein [Arthrobacter sp. RCC_34]
MEWNPVEQSIGAGAAGESTGLSNDDDGDGTRWCRPRRRGPRRPRGSG